MNHTAELALHTFLQKALAGETTVDEAVIEQVGKDVADAVRKQFSSGPRDEFKLRMSNLGRPTCQLWFEKNVSCGSRRTILKIRHHCPHTS
jgi:hypothetical protein